MRGWSESELGWRAFETPLIPELEWNVLELNLFDLNFYFNFIDNNTQVKIDQKDRMGWNEFGS